MAIKLQKNNLNLKVDNTIFFVNDSVTNHIHVYSIDFKHFPKHFANVEVKTAERAIYCQR